MGDRDYRRFYSLLKEMPYADKESLVYQFSHGRTTHLHLMSAEEYDVMCSEMSRVSCYESKRAAALKVLKKKRSICLHLMQLLNVRTSDWSRVDSFCLDRRIAGKRFSRLTESELDRLSVKLRVLLRKMPSGLDSPSSSGGTSSGGMNAAVSTPRAASPQRTSGGTSSGGMNAAARDGGPAKGGKKVMMLVGEG